jgi:predicted RNA methylase
MSGQNTSTAVMQRRVEPHDSLDYYPTPAWSTRALCEFLKGEGFELWAQNVWEPACGEGFMARPLAEYFAKVRATDIFRYSDDHAIADFLMQTARWDDVEFVVTNPPFQLANQFIEKALKVATVGVAMLVRSAFTEGQERYMSLFSVTPPAYVLQFSERVGMFRGRCVQVGAPDPFNLDEKGEPRKAATATSYCWLVWLHGQTDTRYRWIAPCREQMERPGDYPAYAEQWAAISAAKAGGLL